MLALVYTLLADEAQCWVLVAVTRLPAGAIFPSDFWRRARAVFDCIDILQRIYQRSQISARQSVAQERRLDASFLLGQWAWTWSRPISHQK